jgi:hypothetical protein
MKQRVPGPIVGIVYPSVWSVRTARRASQGAASANRKVASHLSATPVDSFSRVLWWLFSSSAGATSRGRIVVALRVQPMNA